MTYLTENAMELMEQFFELKLLQSKNTLHKFKKISQNHSAKPMLNSGVIVMKIMRVYNKIVTLLSKTI